MVASIPRRIADPFFIFRPITRESLDKTSVKGYLKRICSSESLIRGRAVVKQQRSNRECKVWTTGRWAADYYSAMLLEGIKIFPFPSMYARPFHSFPFRRCFNSSRRCVFVNDAISQICSAEIRARGRTIIQ